jgi:hypothetical protein
MKTNKKKRLTVSLLAVVTVLALILTGCGAENAAEHNKYLKDEVLNSQTVDKETSSADKKDKSDKDKTSASEADKDSSKSDDKKDSDKSDNKNTGSSSSSSSSKKPSTGSGSTDNSGSSSSSGSSKPSTGGGSSSSGSSKPSTGGGSSSSGNKPSTGGGNNGSSSKPTEPSKPAHQHNWVTDYKTVHHDAEYKDVYHDAVYEDRPIYKWVGWYECKKCGATFGTNVEACVGHCIECNSTYTFKKEQQPTGEYEKVLVKDAWTEKVLVKDAWDEQVPNGQHCTGCGATK